MKSSSKNRLIGKYGENEAVKYLRTKGYEILTINYLCRFGEIDIIAQYKNIIIFVEVKTRNIDSAIATPAEFVGFAKKEKIEKTAGLYLTSNINEKQPRFDVIEVYIADVMGITRLDRINHIENAWG